MTRKQMGPFCLAERHTVASLSRMYSRTPHPELVEAVTELSHPNCLAQGEIPRSIPGRPVEQSTQDGRKAAVSLGSLVQQSRTRQ